MNIVIAVFAQFVLLQLVHSQGINRLLPIGESILPNQLLYPSGCLGPNIIDYPYEILPNGPILPGLLPSQILPNILPAQPTLLPAGLPNVMPLLPGGLPTVLQTPTATIIQDSTVANNLANALQLLVVSNLLANKLPQNEIIVPNYSPVEFMAPVGPCGYNYFY